MRQIYNAGTTPQEKIVAVNKKFGNTGIQSQQGTSRIIYDSLPMVLNEGEAMYLAENNGMYLADDDYGYGVGYFPAGFGGM
jgi:hypothetical protein